MRPIFKFDGAQFIPSAKDGLVLQIIGILLILAIGGVVIYAFELFVSENYGHKFFTAQSFTLSVLGFCTILAGVAWYESAVKSNSDLLNGMLVTIIGAGLISYVIFRNIKRTGWAVGLIGSAGQIALFSVAAYIGFWLFFLWLVLQILVHIGAQPVYVVNK